MMRLFNIGNFNILGKQKINKNVSNNLIQNKYYHSNLTFYQNIGELTLVAPGKVVKNEEKMHSCRMPVYSRKNENDEKTEKEKDSTDSIFDWTKHIIILKTDCIPILKQFDKFLWEDAEDLMHVFSKLGKAKEEKGYFSQRSFFDRGTFEQFVDPASRWAHSINTAKEKINSLPDDEYGMKIKHAIAIVNKGIDQFNYEVFEISSEENKMGVKLR